MKSLVAFLIAVFCLGAGLSNAGILPDFARRYDDNDQAKMNKQQLKVVALVVGISEYSFGRLANPTNDARAIAKKFRSFGYNTLEVIDPSRLALLDALKRFRSMSSNADAALVYYAGHGVQSEGANFLIPVDFDPSAENIVLRERAMAVSELMDENVLTRIKVVFLDACRNNPFDLTHAGGRGIAVPAMRNLSVGLAPIAVPGNSQTMISFATKDGATASDGSEDHSPYTQSLLKHLDDRVDVVLMLRRVRQEVMDKTNGQQQPWDYGSLLGDRIILAK